jgi:DNA helicase II / ATP-dependent DNA helicase PcrA
MSTPTAIQQEVLQSTARIRVVRAAPGSGKTWLVAEALRAELGPWRSTHSGISALSFTNVAGEEIRRALGAAPTHPHFVGTIDAFLYRYVVRPFARIVNPELEVPRLLPAEAAVSLTERQRWLRDTEIGYSLKRGQGKPITGTLYDCHFVGKNEDGKPEFTFEAGWERMRLTAAENADVMRRKKELWRQSGRMSHSDVAYIASAILARSGGARDLLARRFPLLVVDELQDTGYFRSRTLLSLVAHAGVRTLLVGDPDQAIYGFSGAHPSIFQEFERLPDAACFEVEHTLRCASSTCRVATQLSATGRRVSAYDPTKPGHAILLTHNGDLRPILHLASTLRRQIGTSEGKVALLVRSNAEVNQLLGKAKRSTPDFYCRPVDSLYKAAQAVHDGRMARAKALTEAALGRVLLGTEAPTEEELARVGLAQPEWRFGVTQMLFAAVDVPAQENAYVWGCRMLEEMALLFERRGWSALREPKMPKRPRSNTQDQPPPLARREADEVDGALAIQTVHATKGETHHTTLFFIPKRQMKQCPSATWWPGSDEDSEERRVAFVAASRPKHTFILIVHEETLERLQQHRPSFVDSFSLQSLQAFLKDTNVLSTVIPMLEPAAGAPVARLQSVPSGN